MKAFDIYYTRDGFYYIAIIIAPTAKCAESMLRDSYPESISIQITSASVKGQCIISKEPNPVM